MVDAGVSVEDAIGTLEQLGGTRATRAAATRVRSSVQRGNLLADALGEVGTPLQVTALVAAGERTGRVAEGLRAAADLLSRLAALRGGIRRAMIYPAVVLSLGVGILILVAVAVVPALERTFADLGGELPLATRIVLAVSRTLGHPWFLSAGALLLAARWIVRAVRTPPPTLDILRLPIARGLARDVALTVLAKVVASSLNAGMPFLDSLRAAGRSLPIGRVRTCVEDAASAVEAGRSAFENDGLGSLLDPAEREILKVGERNGVLGAQWARVADRRIRALDERISAMVSVVEPVLVVIVGGLVGGAVLALYLPTFRVLELL
jgi:type IV pilus assembly protein PilC